jgi:hypothetical protein
MKTYNVELKRTSYMTITVEAENEDEADRLAWEEVERGRSDIYDALWELESIEEVTQ